MDREKIIEILPAFMDISDADLRERAIAALLLAMKKGNWDEHNLDAAPTSIRWENYHVSWVEHVTDVVRLCRMCTDVLEKYYARNHTPFDRDTLLCGALLHDIGKFTEYVEKDGKAVFSENSSYLRHPLSGAIIAAEAGLPDCIIHLIATHSFEGDHSYRTPEAEILRTMDMLAYNSSVAGLKKLM